MRISYGKTFKNFIDEFNRYDLVGIVLFFETGEKMLIGNVNDDLGMCACCHVAVAWEMDLKINEYEIVYGKEKMEDRKVKK